MTDTAGNANAVTSGPTVTVDRTGPTVIIDLQAASDSGISTTDDVTNAATLVFDVDLQRGRLRRRRRDFSFAGTAPAAAASTGQPRSARQLRVTVTGCGEGTVTCAFAADGATDTAGNADPRPPADGPEVLIDRTDPDRHDRPAARLG